MSASETSELFSHLEREVWIVTSSDGPRRGGLVATSVVQASIVSDAPRVLVAISRLHATWDLIETSRTFAVHLIPAERLDLLERFGTYTSREIDKFVGIPLEDHPGPPILKDAHGWLACRVEAGWDAGDRTFFLGEVIDAKAPASSDVVLMTTRHLGNAPEAVREAMRTQYEADAVRDEKNIRQWRNRKAP